MSKSKAKGTRAETEVVKYLRQWWPAAERRALSGALDKGDIAGIPGLVIEVKAAATQLIGPWQRETLTEMENASAETGMLVVKRPRKPVSVWDAYLLRVGTLDILADFPEGSPSWLRMDLALGASLLQSLGY
ncbi:hypothetical protein [Streptomyces hoynatensis]|uniref:Holliday junction resolvase n=1 Tax=Streptomyces hoynatensis TaxID=1141874 RepID=A0A3A9YG52_9ACTN|nr:hypothetical protein [Streptomyces hoynatensis]RKN35969.1 hypothetical protein D7294_30530 [Streptomyces hoynatensis]